MLKPYLIITGAASGIGKATVLLAVNKGYHVIAVGRNLFSLLQLKFEASNPELIHPVAADITNYNDLLKIKAAVPLDAKLYAIVHSAAVFEPRGKIAAVANHEYILYHNKTNVSSPLVLTMMLLAQLTTDGRVLFIGSYFNDIAPAQLDEYREVCEAYCESKMQLATEINDFRKQLSEKSPAMVFVKPGRVAGTGIYNAFWKEISNTNNVAIKPKSNTVKPEESAEFFMWLIAGQNKPTNVECAYTIWDIENQAHRDRWKNDSVALATTMRL